jgi:clan AA aspartic protease
MVTEKPKPEKLVRDPRNHWKLVLRRVQAKHMPERELDIVVINLMNGEYVIASTPQLALKEFDARWPGAPSYICRVDGGPAYSLYLVQAERMTPTIEVTLRGHTRSVQIQAIIDTGFVGALCLPMDVASWIGAEIAGWGKLRVADGSEAQLPNAFCEIELLGETANVRAFVTDAPDVLIGTELLQNCRLEIDFDSGTLQLTRKTP